MCFILTILSSPPLIGFIIQRIPFSPLICALPWPSHLLHLFLVLLYRESPRSSIMHFYPDCSLFFFLCSRSVLSPWSSLLGPLLSPSGISLLCPLYHCQEFYRAYIWVTRRVYYKKQKLLTICGHLSSPLYFGGIRVAPLFSFLCCPIVFLYVLSSVL